MKYWKSLFLGLHVECVTFTVSQHISMPHFNLHGLQDILKRADRLEKTSSSSTQLHKVVLSRPWMVYIQSKRLSCGRPNKRTPLGRCILTKPLMVRLDVLSTLRLCFTTLCTLCIRVWVHDVGKCQHDGMQLPPEQCNPVAIQKGLVTLHPPSSSLGAPVMCVCVLPLGLLHSLPQNSVWNQRNYHYNFQQETYLCALHLSGCTLNLSQAQPDLCVHQYLQYLAVLQSMLEFPKGALVLPIFCGFNQMKHLQCSFNPPFDLAFLVI